MGDRTPWYTVTHTSAGTGAERALVRNVTGWPTYELIAGRVGSTGRELGTLELRWYDADPTLAGASAGLPVAWEYFTVDGLPITGPHRGDYLEVVLTNPGAGRQIQVSIADTDAPERRHRSMQITGLVLNGQWSSVAGNGGIGTAVYGLPVSGPVTLYLNAPGQKGEFRVNLGSIPVADVVVDPANDKSGIVTIDANRAPIWVASVTNRGTLAAGYSVRATTGHA